MANIKVKIDYPISDGAKVKFRTPCESTSVEGLVVTYPIKNGVGYATKTLRFVDAHGKELSGLGNVFASDVLIEVMLDVTKGRAFIKNADTNSYIEDIKVTVQRMDEERQVIFAEAGKSITECKDATKKASEAANTLNLSANEIRNGGFIESLKELNNGDKFTFWVGTTEEYEEVKDTIPSHTLCLFTDDLNEERVYTFINETQRNLIALEDKLANMEKLLFTAMCGSSVDASVSIEDSVAKSIKYFVAVYNGAYILFDDIMMGDNDNLIATSDDGDLVTHQLIYYLYTDGKWHVDSMVDNYSHVYAIYV